MLMIGLMLAGCGKCKDLISPSASANDNKPAANAKAASAANADLTAQNTKGLWNWRLRQDGWMSWISSKTIIATASVVLIVSVAGYELLCNKKTPAPGGGPATK